MNKQDLSVLLLILLICAGILYIVWILGNPELSLFEKLMLLR